MANSVLETNRVSSVSVIYVMYGKMGGIPEVRWAKYEDCVMHVRTSHVPRFELEIGTNKSLFDQMGISYDSFCKLDMPEKMIHIRSYAKSRLKPGEKLWWLDDTSSDAHSLPIQARLYTSLSTIEKTRLRAEAVLLCPKIVSSGRSKDKYNDVVLFLLTYHGVLCHQARDLFSAGSVANPSNDDAGGLYIERSLKLLETEMLRASQELPDELFLEYWGTDVPKEHRIQFWLSRADQLASPHWKPSTTLFLNR